MKAAKSDFTLMKMTQRKGQWLGWWFKEISESPRRTMTCEMKMHKTILRPWSRHDTWFKANQVNTSLQISWLWRHSSEEKKNKLCAHLNRFSLRTVTTCNFCDIWHLRRQNCQRDCDILTDSWCIQETTCKICLTADMRYYETNDKCVSPLFVLFCCGYVQK